MSENRTLDNVHRILRWTLGDEYGDGDIVTGVYVGYAEPDYGTSDDDVIVLGNWNPKRFPGPDDPPWTKEENFRPRLAEALARVGAECEWSDEWDSCYECGRAFRISPDSYSWRAAYVETSDYDRYCVDCAIAQGEDALSGYINDESKCVTWCDASHIEQYGYVKWEPSDPHMYENGWHPGQNDDPEQITNEIREQYPDADIVFYLDENSQFYMRFSAYVRVPKVNLTKEVA